MFSKLMLLSLGHPRSGGLRYPSPLVNARALEDVWLLADGAPAQGSRDGHRMGFFRRWRQAIASPIGAEDGIYNP